MDLVSLVKNTIKKAIIVGGVVAVSAISNDKEAKRKKG